MLATMTTPRGVQRLIIGSVVGYEDAALATRKGKLFFVRETSIGTANFMYGDCIDAEVT